MPKYVKFIKEAIFGKKRLEDISSVMMNKECSTILNSKEKLSEKLTNPRSFTIPCTLVGLTVYRALANLGASINLIPLDFFKKLGVGESKPTRMSIQLVNRSTKYPTGIIKDVLVQIEDLVFYINFVLIDMSGDIEVLLILGRPFLATTNALIDVEEGNLTLRLGDKKVLKIPNAMRRLLYHNDICF